MKSYFALQEKGGIVRKVPNKPAKVGIWYYQGTFMLSNGEPFLVNTRVLIRQVTWERAQKFNQLTVICMDSYYLDIVRRQLLKDRGVRYIALSTWSVTNPHQSSETTSQQHWRQQLGMERGPRRSWQEYWREICFVQLLCYDTQRNASAWGANLWVVQGDGLGCDTFNRQLHNRTSPCASALPRDTNLAVEKNIWKIICSLQRWSTHGTCGRQYWNSVIVIVRRRSSRIFVINWRWHCGEAPFSLISIFACTNRLLCVYISACATI